MVQLDPVLVLTARYAVGTLLLAAGLSKLREWSYFRATLRSYELLPEMALRPLGLALPLVELVVGTAAQFEVTAWWAMPVATALLVIYTLAIAVNVVRGRRNIDCGCSGPALRQDLSGWLVTRNLAIVALALCGCFAPVARTVGFVDYAIIGLAFIAASVLYAAANQLSANAPHLRAMDAYMEGT